MVLGGLPLLWGLSGRALAGMGGQGEILQTVVFVALSESGHLGFGFMDLLLRLWEWFGWFIR